MEGRQVARLEGWQMGMVVRQAIAFTASAAFGDATTLTPILPRRDYRLASMVRAAISNTATFPYTDRVGDVVFTFAVNSEST